MSETYASGTWIVKPGEEDAFVKEWTAFVTWASSMPGSGSFRLVRDLDNPSHYTSFAPWESFDAQNAWKELPESPTGSCAFAVIARTSSPPRMSSSRR